MELGWGRSTAGNHQKKVPPGTPLSAEEALCKELNLENRCFLRGKSQAKRRQRVKEIIARWKSVFTDETTKVGVTDYVDPFNIELEPGTKPVRQRTRPLTPVQVETLKKQLADWTSEGIIAPSASAWASPLVPVMKKEGTVRWAIDFRALNLHTVPDSFPKPNIADVLQTFAGSKCFSTLDASQAYMNILVKKDCQSMTAFVCCFGLFEFLRMPFGLKNAGAAYCRLVQAVVDEINDPGLSAYLDDIILHTGDPEAHVDLLERTLEAHFQHPGQCSREGHCGCESAGGFVVCIAQVAGRHGMAECNSEAAAVPSVVGALPHNARHGNTRAGGRRHEGHQVCVRVPHGEPAVYRHALVQ